MALLGTISRGTLRNEDLLRNFNDTLAVIDTNGDFADLIKECDAVLLLHEKAGWKNIMETEEVSELINEALFDALNCLAPACCYFGAHPGDGSDFGFWVDTDAIRDDIHDGEIVQIEDTSEVTEDGLYLEVNDHGNMTLYLATDNGLTVTEQWSLV